MPMPSTADMPIMMMGCTFLIASTAIPPKSRRLSANLRFSTASRDSPAGKSTVVAMESTAAPIRPTTAGLSPAIQPWITVLLRNFSYSLATIMIITTTPTIEGRQIESYIGLSSANVVVGTNVFSDFFASITDVLGGRSSSYQNKLDKTYKTAIEEIELKASRMGADAVVGLKIDFNEISSKDKAMFMVSAVGTAVKLR